MKEKSAQELNGSDFARSGSGDPGSDRGSGDPLGAFLGSPGLSKGRRSHFIGIGIAIALALGIGLVVALGDIAFLAIGVGIGAAVGIGFLIGVALCEALNRRN